jgi:hypothetical protein
MLGKRTLTTTDGRECVRGCPSFIETRNLADSDRPSTVYEDLGSSPILHDPQDSHSSSSISATPTSKPTGTPPSPLESRSSSPIIIKLPQQVVEADVGGSPLVAQPTDLHTLIHILTRSLRRRSWSLSPLYQDENDNYDQPRIIAEDHTPYRVQSRSGDVTVLQPRGRRSMAGLLIVI